VELLILWRDELPLVRLRDLASRALAPEASGVKTSDPRRFHAGAEVPISVVLISSETLSNQDTSETFGYLGFPGETK
jgi:hypothetical protein